MQQGIYPLHLLPTVPMNLHKQYNNISPFLFYSIIAFKQENGSTRMIQSISSQADLVVALASSKSSLGTCKRTTKKIIHPCVKNTKNTKSRLQKQFSKNTKMVFTDVFKKCS